MGGGVRKLSSQSAHGDNSGHSATQSFAERVNFTLFEPVRVMLEEAGLSARYWEYEIEHTAYVKNRLPHSALDCSPFEKLTETKLTLKHIRTLVVRCLFVRKSRNLNFTRSQSPQSSWAATIMGYTLLSD